VSVDRWPVVGVEVTSGAITARGGAVLLRDVMAALDVAGEVNDCVGLKQRRRGLSEGQFVAVMAESIA
jgi:hypothetical protein